MASRDRRRQGESIPRQVGSEAQQTVLTRALEGEERPGLGRVDQVEGHYEHEGSEGEKSFGRCIDPHGGLGGSSMVSKLDQEEVSLRQNTRDSVGQWFSQCGPCMGGIGATWELEGKCLFLSHTVDPLTGKL